MVFIVVDWNTVIYENCRICHRIEPDTNGGGWDLSWERKRRRKRIKRWVVHHSKSNPKAAWFSIHFVRSIFARWSMFYFYTLIFLVMALNLFTYFKWIAPLNWCGWWCVECSFVWMIQSELILSSWPTLSISSVQFYQLEQECKKKQQP